jgi:hypothetical protein
LSTLLRAISEMRGWTTKAFGGFHLGNFLTFHPLPERFGKLATEEHHSRLMRREAEIKEHIICALYFR